MSIFCSSTSSTSGTIVSKLAPRRMLSFLYPDVFAQLHRPRSKRQPKIHTLRQPESLPSANGLESWFFTSLASASRCCDHNPKAQQRTFFTPQRPGVCFRRQPNYNARRRQHSAAVAVAEQQIKRSMEENLALVDQYDGESNTDRTPLLELPRLHPPSDGPHLTVSDKEDDEWPPPNSAWPADPETTTKIALLKRALRDHTRDPEEIYQMYRDLPSPRAPYLESGTRHRLLHELSVVEEKDEHSMIRYFSVIDDMKATAIPLNTHEWTSAISFAARFVSKSTEVEVEAALRMWKEMEHVAGVKGNEATFNVLYDVACKAGKFVLADMIYKEMEVRGLEFNRFHHVSRIHYFGLRGDGDGARAAYKTLVEAGEMVDTVVLNAIISALIRSHEANAADNIYQRMKNAYLEDNEMKLPPRDFKAQRKLRRSYMDMAITAKQDTTKREEFQKNTIIAPDIDTFRILVNYFAIQAGELDKVAKLLDDMRELGIPVQGVIFAALFNGFALHGGIRYTEWTKTRLERVWEAFMKGLDDGAEDLLFSKWLAIWAINAFSKCSGKGRTVEIWEQLKEKWEPDELDMDHILHALRDVLEKEDAAEKQDDWLLAPLKE